MRNTWYPCGWRDLPIAQQPSYEDMVAMRLVEAKLQEQPEIVSEHEIMELRSSLKKVVNGQAIVLQGGDCVETFASINPNYLVQHSEMMVRLATLLQDSIHKEVIVIGRVAGQFAKPRSHDFESDDHMPIYRGDMVNSIDRTHQARKADPNRLLYGYHKSVEAYQLLKQHMKIGHYISHEALLLNYEQCLTRCQKDQYFNMSAHFLWIGKRTRSLQGAHIEYIRGIGNPIGIKIDEQASVEEVVELIKIVNPDNIPGKLTLIFRLGVKNIRDLLPQIIRAIRKENKSVICMCDPMHGNTIVESGKKIRYCESILLELEYFIDILKVERMHFGGIHLEMTNQDIIECVEKDGIMKDYNSYCDPRLNFQQSVKLMSCISKSVV